MKTTKWFYNIATGVFLTFGFTMFLWIILSGLGLPQISMQNAVFLLEIVTVPWALNFIFHFNSSLLVKGILHSILWLILSLIVYSLNYHQALEAQLLLIIILIYFSLYAAGLSVFSFYSKKLNTPVRHIADFLHKVNKMP